MYLSILLLSSFIGNLAALVAVALIIAFGLAWLKHSKDEKKKGAEKAGESMLSPNTPMPLVKDLYERFFESTPYEVLDNTILLEKGAFLQSLSDLGFKLTSKGKSTTVNRSKDGLQQLQTSETHEVFLCNVNNNSVLLRVSHGVAKKESFRFEGKVLPDFTPIVTSYSFLLPETEGETDPFKIDLITDAVNASKVSLIVKPGTEALKSKLFSGQEYETTVNKDGTSGTLQLVVGGTTISLGQLQVKELEKAIKNMAETPVVQINKNKNKKTSRTPKK